MMTFFYYFN